MKEATNDCVNKIKIQPSTDTTQLEADVSKGLESSQVVTRLSDDTGSSSETTVSNWHEVLVFTTVENRTKDLPVISIEYIRYYGRFVAHEKVIFYSCKPLFDCRFTNIYSHPRLHLHPRSQRAFCRCPSLSVTR